MASDSLVVRREGGCVVVQLNRPEKLNALNKEIYEDLSHHLDVLKSDKTIRSMIITGQGEKAFCVGADLKERFSMNEKDIWVRLEFVRILFQRLEQMPFLVIAAINGIALGGGFELALACDMRVAVKGTILGLPEVELAIIPGSGGTQRLSRIIGMGRALEWTLLAKRATAEEALAVGVLNSVTEPNTLMSVAQGWASRMAEIGPIALRQAKYAIRSGFDLSLEEGLRLETEAYRPCLYSKDRTEGLKAFQEKRKPQYRGE